MLEGTLCPGRTPSIVASSAQEGTISGRPRVAALCRLDAAPRSPPPLCCHVHISPTLRLPGWPSPAAGAGRPSRKAGAARSGRHAGGVGAQAEVLGQCLPADLAPRKPALPRLGHVLEERPALADP